MVMPSSDNVLLKAPDPDGLLGSIADRPSASSRSQRASSVARSPTGLAATAVAVRPGATSPRAATAPEGPPQGTLLRLVQQQGIAGLAPLVDALPQLARLEGLEETSKPQLQAPLRLAPLRDRQSAGAGGLRCHLHRLSPVPGGPVERTITYETPWSKCDRVEDYRGVWGVFEKEGGSRS